MSGRSPDELVRLLHDSLERAGQEREPPAYEQLEAYVDGRLDDVDREIVDSWLADDADLRAEVESLRELRAELGPASDAPRVVPFGAPAARAGDMARPRGRRWWPIAVAAGLAAAVVGAQLVWRAAMPAPSTVAGDGAPPPAPAPETRAPAPALAVTISDRARTLGLTADGRLAGADGVPPDVAARLATMLREQRLPPSRLGARVAAGAGVLMSADAAGTAFRPVGPVATAVLASRPTFRWTALPDARAYRVRVVDERLQPIAESPALPTLTWRPPAALPAGQVLIWQVEAETAEGPRTTPAPPLPEARFVVLAPDAGARVEAALRAMPSDLAVVLIAAEAGLYDEAEAGLVRLREGNAGSRVLEALQRDLDDRRGRAR